MFSGIGMQELLIIFLVVLLLFGAKRIPDIASGLGRGIRDFKKALKDTKDEISVDSSASENKDDKKNG
jgi:sec-independent protein translocase protein TatA